MISINEMMIKPVIINKITKLTIIRFHVRESQSFGVDSKHTFIDKGAFQSQRESIRQLCVIKSWVNQMLRFSK